MSGFPKMLWEIVVPTGGWDFCFNDGGAKIATVPAATYTSILDLADELEDQMNAASAVNFVVTVSQIGIVVIDGDAAWNTAWATTDNDFSDCLGFAETEAVVATVLTATSQHLHGYYPGLVSYGYDAGRGAGLTKAFVWKPTWPMVRTHAGSGATRSVGPVTASEDCEFALSIIKWTEYEDDEIGVRAWQDECQALQFRLYRDRYEGTVVAPGTQDTEYFLCTFNSNFTVRDGPHPDYLLLSVDLHREPR